MDSLWCHRPLSFTQQTRRSYDDFVRQIDALTDRDVVWTSYTDAIIEERTRQGLSSFCFRDRQCRLTKTSVVFDIYVEEYQVHRVVRQFGLYQELPLPVIHTVDARVHRWSRKGVKTAAVPWEPKLLGITRWIRTTSSPSSDPTMMRPGECTCSGTW